MFSADRDGSQNEAGTCRSSHLDTLDSTDGWTAFHVEAPDQTQNEVIYGVSPPPGERPGVPSRTAPSRPPSRTSQQGFKDWVDQPAGSNPPTDPALTMTAAPRSHAQEEEDMQRALRESAQEAGVSMPEPEQQTGVTGPSTSATYFGPANRGEYDPSQWTMVPSVEAEIPQASQVAASRRKRGSEVPAFLVEGPSEFGSHRLGALLTILHGIPLVRNLILEAGGPFTSYGHNSQWWKGQQIIPPQVLARLSTGDADPAQLPEGVNFEEELHRLMAFLDSTERSYGTVSVLAHLVPQAWASIERQFYDHFTNRNPAENSPFYSRVAIGKAQSEDDETEQENFCVLESQSTKNTFANIRTLYELIDHIMWGDLLNWQESFDEARMAMFQDMGDILTIDLTGEGPPKSIEIPEEFYPERWLENRKDEAWQIQVAWKETIDAAAKVEDAKVKLYQFYDDEARRAFDIRDVALRAEEHFKSSCEYLEGRGRFRTVEGSGFDLDKYPDFRAAPPQMTAGEDELYKKLKEGASYARRLLEDKRSEMEGKS